MRAPNARSSMPSTSRAARLASTMRSSASNQSTPDSSESKMRRLVSDSTRSSLRFPVEWRL